MHTIPGLFLHSNVDYSIKTVTHLFGIEKKCCDTKRNYMEYTLILESCQMQ